MAIPTRAMQRRRQWMIRFPSVVQLAHESSISHQPHFSCAAHPGEFQVQYERTRRRQQRSFSIKNHCPIIAPQLTTTMTTTALPRWFSSFSLNTSDTTDGTDEDSSAFDAKNARVRINHEQHPQVETTRATTQHRQDEIDPNHRHPKHCRTCTCDKDTSLELQHNQQVGQESESCPFSATSAFEREPDVPMPPPLPEPKNTFLRRVLNENEDKSSNNDSLEFPVCVALDSMEGRHRLVRSLQERTSHSYIALQNHFVNQSEPTYCGVTTLLVILNAFAIDPLRRWKGGWRYYGHEDLIFQNCIGCLEPLRIQRVGLTLAQFAQLATCQGLTVDTKQPPSTETTDDTAETQRRQEQQQFSVSDFRRDIVDVLTTKTEDSSRSTKTTSQYDITKLLVVSYARSTLGQTGGGGHFAPVAAYDANTDSVLLLDVARFKYPPYWVSIVDLYHAMQYPHDVTTKKPRGWFLLYPPPISSSFYQGSVISNEMQRPAELVPSMDEVNQHLKKPSPCPGYDIKVQYCPNNENKGRGDESTST